MWWRWKQASPFCLQRPCSHIHCTIQSLLSGSSLPQECTSIHMPGQIPGIYPWFPPFCYFSSSQHTIIKQIPLSTTSTVYLKPDYFSPSSLLLFSYSPVGTIHSVSPLLICRKSFSLLGPPRVPKSRPKQLIMREVENAETKESSQARNNSLNNRVTGLLAPPERGIGNNLMHIFELLCRH